MTKSDVCELAEQVLEKALREAAGTFDPGAAMTWMQVADAAACMAGRYEESEPDEAGP